MEVWSQAASCREYPVSIRNESLLPAVRSLHYNTHEHSRTLTDKRLDVHHPNTATQPHPTEGLIPGKKKTLQYILSVSE